jgi:hypothetical protein
LTKNSSSLIINQGDKQLLNRIDHQEIKRFLAGIPSLPLDVTISAYYLVATKIPYDKYIKYLEQCDESFSNLQENLLRETGDYINTRYKLIILSLKKLMCTHKDFKELLFFISLLDSQHIPRELLEIYKNDVSIDEFIYNLKIYSFITDESISSLYSISTFSIHRSTQKIILNYFIKNLNLEEKKYLIGRMTKNLEIYVDRLIEKEDLEKLRLLGGHCETFLSHNRILTESAKASIAGRLGRILLNLGHYLKAKQFLESSLLHHNNLENKNQEEIARALGDLGNVDGDLGHYEKAKRKG